MIHKIIIGIWTGLLVLFMCSMKVYAAQGMDISLSGVGDKLMLTVTPKADTDLCLYSYDGGVTFVSQSFTEISNLQLNSEGNAEITVIAKDTQGNEYRAVVCISAKDLCFGGEAADTSEVIVIDSGDDNIQGETADLREEATEAPDENDNSFDDNRKDVHWKVPAYLLIGCGCILLLYVLPFCPKVYCEAGLGKWKYLGRALILPGNAGLNVSIGEDVILRAKSTHLKIKFSYPFLFFSKYKFVEISAGNCAFERSAVRELYVDFYET